MATEQPHATDAASDTTAHTEVAGAHDDHGGGFLTSAADWMALSFVVFVLILWRTVWPALIKALDSRAQAIKQQLDDAAQLRSEAQQLYADYEAKQAAVRAEAEAMRRFAITEAEAMRQRLKTDLEKALLAKSQAAEQRLAVLEQQSLHRVRQQAVESLMVAMQHLGRSLDPSAREALLKSDLAQLQQG